MLRRFCHFFFFFFFLRKIIIQLESRQLCLLLCIHPSVEIYRYCVVCQESAFQRNLRSFKMLLKNKCFIIAILYQQFMMASATTVRQHFGNKTKIDLRPKSRLLQIRNFEFSVTIYGYTYSYNINGYQFPSTII